MYIVYLSYFASFGIIASGAMISSAELKSSEKSELINRLLSAKSKFIFMRSRQDTTTLPVLQIVREFFLGNKFYFRDTDIFATGNTEKQDGTWIEYPIIDIDWSTTNVAGLLHSLQHQISKTIKIHHLPQGSNIFTLIKDIYVKYSNRSVVILMDNYDDSILKNKNSPFTLNCMQNVFSEFHSIIKN